MVKTTWWWSGVQGEGKFFTEVYEDRQAFLNDLAYANNYQASVEEEGWEEGKDVFMEEIEED